VWFLQSEMSNSSQVTDQTEASRLRDRAKQRITLIKDDDESPVSRPQPIPTTDPSNDSEGRLFDGENTPQNIATYGFGLGMLAGCSVAFAATGVIYPQMWLFLMCLAIFHFLEYLATALFNGPKLSLDCKWIKHRRN
jgi:hypothetical protein